MNVLDSILLLKNVDIPQKAHLEIEARFYIDERKKSDVSVKVYSKETSEEIAKQLIKKLSSNPTSVEQTINFISNEKIKQLVFINGEQQKDKLTHYTKTKILNNMFLLHNELPGCRLSAGFESSIDEFPTVESQLARIKLRHSTVLNDWRLDITLVRNITDFNNPLAIKAEKNSMLFPINSTDFIEKAPWSKANVIEFELEYIGDIQDFSVEKLKIINDIFADISALDRPLAIISEKSGSPDSAYQADIYQVAKLIRGPDAYKFKQTDGIKQLSNQVFELDKNMFLRDVLHNITNYTITDKLDGKRTIIYIREGHATAISDVLEVVKLAKNVSSTYVLDCEGYIEPESKELVYYIFDVMVFDGVDISNEPFGSRMQKFNDAVTLSPSFRLKPFITLTDNFKKQIATFKKEKKPYETDGIILTPIDGQYTTMQVYKYKPIDKLSVDFLIKKCPDKLHGITPYIQKPKHTLYLLFCGIQSNVFQMLNMQFIKHYDDIFPGIDTRNLPRYFPVQFQPSDEQFAYLYWHQDEKSLDGLVGEFVYETDLRQWTLHKIRHDRQIEVQRGTYFGNNYKIAELTWMNYRTPLIIEELDDKQDIYFQQHSNPLQEASRHFNSFVKSKIFESIRKTNCVMDMASGKGQDLFRYGTYQVGNVVCLEIDGVALLELVSRKHDYGRNGKSPMNITTQQLDLNADYKENISKLSSIQFKTVDVVMCNFAFHYFIKNKASLTNVLKFIQYWLKPGGKFIFTSFDAKAIIRLLNEHNGNWTIKQGNKIKYSIKKQYTVNYLEPIGQKIEVLLPFSSDKYYSEYLVNIDYITEVAEKLGFLLEIDQGFDEFLQDYKRQNSAEYNKMDSSDMQYSSLYHYYCFHKKSQTLKR